MEDKMSYVTFPTPDPVGQHYLRQLGAWKAKH